MGNALVGYLGRATQQGREVLDLGSMQPFQMVTSTGAGFTWVGTDTTALGDLIVLANKDNIGEVRVAVDLAVGAANYFPLKAGDSLGLPGVSLSQVNLWFADNTDKLHLAYMKE